MLGVLENRYNFGETKNKEPIKTVENLIRKLKKLLN